MGRKVWVPVVSGPLAPYAAGFESWLRSRAYSPSAAADRLYQFDQLSRWLEREGLGVGELTGEQAERFAAARRAAGRGDVGLAAERGAAAGVPAASWGSRRRRCRLLAQGPLEELLADYGRYLLGRAWAVASTRCSMRMCRRRGCSWPSREGPDGLGLERLSAADVSSFLARECPKRSVSGARDLVCALRSLLRYLHLAGLIEAPLVWAVPVGRRSAGSHAAARSGTGGGHAGCWPACDRRRLVGRRDFAILLLLSRLGLRAGEVAAIAARRRRLAGRAAARSRQGRPPGRAAVARRCRRGDRVLSSPSPAVRVPGAVRAGDRAAPGAEPVHDRRGSCARRVTGPGCPGSARIGCGTPPRPRCCRPGASLAEIGQVLRHREQKTTAIYAKVDRTALRPLARPWPSPAGVA